MAAKENKSNKPKIHPKKGDAGTLNTTDPQEHMEGPVSSLMHKAGEEFPDKMTKKEVKKKTENQ